MRNTGKCEVRTIYDVESITAYAKRKLRRLIISAIALSVLFIASVTAIILYSRILPVFICGIILSCTSASCLGRLLHSVRTEDYTSVCGEIADVHKEIKIVRTTLVGGINPFGPRKYDKYNKEEVRLEICIQGDEEIRGYFMTETTEEHAAYYEARGEAMHMWGTRFPVRLSTDDEKWLCPICGEFNSRDKKHCMSCGIKAIK